MGGTVVPTHLNVPEQVCRGAGRKTFRAAGLSTVISIDHPSSNGTFSPPYHCLTTSPWFWGVGRCTPAGMHLKRKGLPPFLFCITHDPSRDPTKDLPPPTYTATHTPPCLTYSLSLGLMCTQRSSCQRGMALSHSKWAPLAPFGEVRDANFGEIELEAN